MCTELCVHLLRHNRICSLDTSTTVTKLGRHIDVIMVHPVILHMAGIVVGYWRKGCSYRNIDREVGLHSNTVVKILFVEGVPDDHVQLMTGMTACCIALPWKTDDWVYRGWGVHGSQTVNSRLGARAYKARRMVKVSRITVRAKLVRPRHWAQKHINRPLGQWQHVVFCDESRFMLFRIDNRIRVRRQVVEAMNEECTHDNVVSLIMEKPPCAFWIRISLEPCITELWRKLGFTWQGMVSQQLDTGWW